MAEIIEWQDFEKVELRVGTIVTARVNEKAKKPAYVLEVDLGELGVKTSSAQITVHYTPASLVGRQVLCVCNFPPKRIAGTRTDTVATTSMRTPRVTGRKRGARVRDRISFSLC